MNWSFAIVVPTMFSFKYHFSCKFKHLSSAEQYPDPTPYFDLPSSITPWYLEDIMPSHYILWISDEVVPFPVIVTPMVLGCRQPRTPRIESNPHYNSVPSSTLLLRSLMLHHVIPSLIGYIIIVLILTVLPGPYSRSIIFDDELSLRRSSSSYHFALNSKLGFECVSYPWS